MLEIHEPFESQEPLETTNPLKNHKSLGSFPTVLEAAHESLGSFPSIALRDPQVPFDP
jgi:hypothetical protein